MPAIRKILAAIDFTEPSDAALDYAIDLAEKLGATVVALHAYEIPIYGFPDAAFVAPPDIATKMLDAAKAGLDAAVATRANAGVKVQGILREGPPWEVVNTVAGEVGADLIVLGTHGRRGLSRALLGSVAERVIRTATQPVLAVQSAQAAQTGARVPSR
jgi:nucleotide-binding universal stress UspA family protein